MMKVLTCTFAVKIITLYLYEKIFIHHYWSVGFDVLCIC
jgi:hypothetical protein